MTGLPIGRIGNSILRTHIAAVLLNDLVGKKLVEAGRLSHAEYKDVLHQASEELHRISRPGHAWFPGVGSSQASIGRTMAHSNS
jgi:hypothetical protein